MPTETESMPLSEYLIKVGGVDPAKAAVLGAQGEAMAGRGGPAASPSAAALQAVESGSQADVRQRGAIASSVLERVPDAPQPPPRNTVTQAQAQEALAAHEAARLADEMAKAYAPPISANEYRFPPPPGRELTDEEFQQEVGIKSAFLAEGFPRFLGELIASDAVEGVNALEGMTPEQAQARVSATAASLKRMWGTDFEANITRLDTYLAQVNARHPSLGMFAEVRLSDRDVPLLELLGPQTINSLLEFAKHRAGRR